MARDVFARKVHRLVEVVDAIGHSVRMTATLRTLQKPDGIPAGEAFPTEIAPAGRGRHIKKLRLLFDVERPSKNEDSIYSLSEGLRRPLRDAIDALDRVAILATTKRRPSPYVAVTIDNDGTLVVDGERVADRRVVDVLRTLLSS